jgi:hypothetical protein
MKKLIISMIILFVSLSAFAQEAPTEQEVIRVIEGLWHCIGTGDFENLERYVATNEGLEMFKLFSLALNEEQKTMLKNFTVLDIAEIQHRPSPSNSGDYFYILYQDNLPDSNPSRLSYQFLRKINGTWRISDFN